MGSRRPSVLAVFCLRGRSQAIGVVAVTWSLLVGFSYSGGAEEVTAILLAREGQVDYSKTASTNWVAATNAQRLALSERLRTLERSSAAVQLADLSVIRLRQLSILTLLAPRKTTARARLDFTAGWLYFFHRNQPREIEVQTPSVTAGIDGTEFHLEVDANQRTVLTLVDGEVEMSNPFGTLHLTSGEQGIADPGQAPRKVIGIDTLNIIQWCLYYPGVLDPDELDLTAGERTSLGPSLEAYRRGDLRGALDNLPAVGPGGSAAERTYRAGVRLSSGAETNYDVFVASLEPAHPLSTALRWLVAAVTQRTRPPAYPATNASQLLGYSYYLQARYNLTGALAAASAAVERSPRFGFAWERVAELEFGFGRLAAAEAALDRALALAPANAQALALKGFLLLGRRQTGAAFAAFEEALRQDDRLGNAWLGRGLCRLYRNQTQAGRADLQTAAAMEPNRSLLRSYLGKAYHQAAERAADPATRSYLVELAEKELNLARELDPKDPTPLLYSALLKHQDNRDNEAIRDLEESVALNDNRRVYRSRLLLDQDRAVRSANLARIYQSAGLTEFSLQEAARSVNADYANYSAHLFLADSYNGFRDPNRVNLRDETAWSNERFLANLLAPVGASSLSQSVSQQEYSSLFRERDFGLSSVTEILSNGDLRETASQFGTLGRLSYSLDPEYFRVKGFYPNTDLSRLEWYSEVKLQLTPQDALFAQTKYQDFQSGDIIPYFDRSQIRRNFRFSEVQDPLLFVGYDHKWSESVHTLFLGSRLINDLRYHDLAVPGIIFIRETNVVVDKSIFPLYDVDYRSRFETYTAELTQILQAGQHALVLGGRIQSGDFTTRNVLTNIEQYQPGVAPGFVYPSRHDQQTDLWRASVYAYDIWQVAPGLFLTAGLAYDRLDYPENFRSAPISTGQVRRQHVSPKGAFHWTPAEPVTLRAVYAQSLGGVSFEDSVRLEPTQLGGFNQSFRNVIPQSIVGSVSGPVDTLLGAALEWRPRPDTKLELKGEILRSSVDRALGVFDFLPPSQPVPTVPSSTREELRYRERTLAFTGNQLLARDWSLGFEFRLIDSRLQRRYPSIPATLYPYPAREQALLNQATLFVNYEHPSGLFGRGELSWFIQDNFRGADESLTQLNLFAGWRLARRRFEAAVGLLNVTGENYRLNPLTPYPNLPRERVWMARLGVNF